MTAHEPDPSRGTTHRSPDERSIFNPRRMFPGYFVLRGYRRSWLRGDVLAGITVAAYLVPQVMAYAEVAGLPAIAGLWAAIGPLVLYALLGSSRRLSAGPESTTALLTVAGAASIAAHNGVEYTDVAALLAFAVAVIAVVGWLGRLGFLADLISRPALNGYLTGIAVLMILSQLGKVTGLSLDSSTSWTLVRSLAQQLGQIHWPTLILAVVSLAAMMLMRRIVPLWPTTLIVMVAAALAVVLLGLREDGVRVVGDVPRGLPGLSIPSLEGVDISMLAVAAVGLAIVAYTDTTLTARAFEEADDEPVDANQEFLALGATNAAAGLMQGFPVSSSASRTALARSMAAQTQLHSIVSAMLLVATLLFFGPALEYFPTAVLGAVVIYAAIRIVDFAELRRLARFRVTELAIALTTSVAVVVIGVLEAIGIAIVLSVLDLLRRLAFPHDAVLGYAPGVAGMHDIEDYPGAEQVPGLIIYRFDSAIFFANAESFRRRALEAFDSQHEPHWFGLNMEANVELDSTGVMALEEVHRAVTKAGAQFAIVRARQPLRDQLTAAGLTDVIGTDRIFTTLPTLVAAYTEWHEQTFGVAPEDEKG